MKTVSVALQEMMRYHNCEEYYCRLLREYPGEEEFICQRLYELKADEFNRNRHKHPMYIYPLLLAGIELELRKKYGTDSVSSNAGADSDDSRIQEIPTELVTATELSAGNESLSGDVASSVPVETESGHGKNAESANVIFGKTAHGGR